MNTIEHAVAVFSTPLPDFGATMKSRNVTVNRAWCRALLPWKEEVKRKDVLKAGVALRAAKTGIEVVPYVFRVICTNGALWSHCGASFTMRVGEFTDEAEIEEFIRSSMQMASREEAFQACIEEVRTGIKTRLDWVKILNTVNSLPSNGANDLLAILMEAYGESRIETNYDAMNAVTAAARDQKDPEMQWNMEKHATLLLLARLRPGQPRRIGQQTAVSSHATELSIESRAEAGCALAERG